MSVIPKTFKNDVLKFLNIKIDLRNPSIKNFIKNENGLEKYQQQLNLLPEYKKKYNLRKAQKKFQDKKREQTQAQRKNDYIASVDIYFNTIFLDKEGKEYKPLKSSKNITFEFKNTTKKEINKELDFLITNEKNKIIGDEYNGIIMITDTKTNIYINENLPKRRNLVIASPKKLRNQDTLNEDEWDLGTGECVIDYIYYIYGKNKNTNFFRTKELIRNCFYNPSHITLEDIDAVFKDRDLTYYAFDAFERLIMFNESKKRTHTNILIFQIVDNHIYPFSTSQRNKKIKKALSIISGTNKTIKKDTETKEITQTKLEHILIDNAEEEMIKLINKSHFKPKNIQLNSKKQIKSFQYENIIYTEKNKNYDDIKEYYEKFYNLLNENDKTKYKPNYFNQSITIIIEMLKDILNIKNMLGGNVNKGTFEILEKAKEARIRTGLININKPIEATDKAYDINKCYSSILLDPIEEWIIPSFLSTPEKYEYIINSKVPIGLYYVSTNDKTLFQENNWYSSAIINKAVENIKLVRETTPENYKSILNNITGLLGKAYLTSNIVNITSNENEIKSYIFDNPDNNNKKIIQKKLNDTDYNIIGLSTNQRLLNISIIAYLQILDQSQIKLFDYTKYLLSFGNTKLIGYKTDCIIVRPNGSKLPIINNSTTWGALRSCELPFLQTENIIKSNNFIKDDKDWVLYPSIYDSKQTKEIYELIQTIDGLLITGDAGRGKSLIIKYLKELYGNNGKYLAFTNKASLNIGGQTIHSFLNLNIEGDIDINKINNSIKNIDIIIVDEISMINNELWYYLELIKELKPSIKFILVGDFKQLPAIEEFDVDYINQPFFKELVGYNHINLTIDYRNDGELKEFSRDYNNNDIIKKLKPHKFPITNFCYTNNKRKEINSIINNHIFNNIISEEEPVLLIKKEERPDEYNNDIYIYKDLKIICCKTKKAKDTDVYWFNNEYFNVVNVDIINKKINIMVIRPDRDYIYSIDKIIFNKYFRLNYCSTIHKAQGETIKDNFNIYEWNIMNDKMKYTAITRAINIKNIGINHA